MATRKSAAEGSEPLRPLDLDAGHSGRTSRPPYAIVDIGSNSVRMVVYDQLASAPDSEVVAGRLKLLAAAVGGREVGGGGGLKGHGLAMKRGRILRKAGSR
jgi:hypothetical protein